MSLTLPCLSLYLIHAGSKNHPVCMYLACLWLGQRISGLWSSLHGVQCLQLSSCVVSWQESSSFACHCCYSYMTCCRGPNNRIYLCSDILCPPSLTEVLDSSFPHPGAHFISPGPFTWAHEGPTLQQSIASVTDRPDAGCF